MRRVHAPRELIAPVVAALLPAPGSAAAVLPQSAARVDGCDWTDPARQDPDLYCIELIPIPDVPAGEVELDYVSSPFGVAVDRDGGGRPAGTGQTGGRTQTTWRGRRSRSYGPRSA